MVQTELDGVNMLIMCAFDINNSRIAQIPRLLEQAEPEYSDLSINYHKLTLMTYFHFL